MRPLAALVLVSLLGLAAAAPARADQAVEQLIEAIYEGDAAAVERALAAGADPNAKGEYGDPLLFHAIDSEQPEIVSLLVRYKANVNIKNDEYGIPAFSNACAAGNLEVIQLLIDSGADIKATDKFGSNALEEAAYSGRKAVAKKLREMGLTTKWPLHVAAGLGEVEDVRRLAADPQRINQPVKGWLDTPLMFAVMGGQLEAARYLLENGADPNLPGEDGSFPIGVAAVEEKVEFCKLLIEHGADVNARVEDNDTPLAWAATPEVAALLMRAGAKAPEQTPRGKTLREWWAGVTPAREKPPAAPPAG